MKISRNSWHFRFLSYVNPSKALDISFDVRRGKYYSECRYFWLILWNLVSRGIMTLCCVAFLLAVLVGMVTGPYHVIMDAKPDLGIFESLGLGMWILIVWAIVYAIIRKFFEFIVLFVRKLPNKEHHQEIKPDGLIKSFIKSKKEKVCKKIEFVD